MALMKDITGQRFSRLVVVAIDGKDHRGEYRWLCRCDCGNNTSVKSSKLRYGKIKSCGCYRKSGDYKRTHGRSHTTEHWTWWGIIDRCTNKKNGSFSRYGARGIKICSGWRNDFESFFADMGQKPSPKHSVDRMNNDGHYSCGHCDECVENGWTANCRWATQREQCNNTSANTILEFQGKTMTVTQWAEEIGLQPSTLWARIFDNGWTVERALTTLIMNPQCTKPRPGRRHQGT